MVHKKNYMIKSKKEIDLDQVLKCFLSLFIISFSFKIIIKHNIKELATAILKIILSNFLTIIV